MIRFWKYRHAFVALALLACVVLIVVAVTDEEERQISRGAPHFTIPPARLIMARTHFKTRRDPPVVEENMKPGTTSWHLDVNHPGDIEGYASRTSVAAGESLTFMVRTQSHQFRADVFRLGWYHGAGGRLIDRIAAIPGDRQASCPMTKISLMTICTWRPTFTVRTGADWVSGIYLVKLIASKKDESYIPFTVREAKPRAPILFQSSVTSWEAYNTWGGRNLYFGPCRIYGRAVCRDQRSRAVSFDRPYVWPGATGHPEDLLGLEYPLLFMLESRGYDVAYVTDVDLQENRDDLARRALFLSVGHDEYYSPKMRANLQNALDLGTSLGFLGANDIFRRIRFAPSPLGLDRIEVNYKNAKEDPLAKSHPAEATTNWPAPPNPQPEQSLIGSDYACSGVHGDWVATGNPAWLFKGTGFVRGSIFPNLFEREVDRINRHLPVPGGLVIVGQGLLRCKTSDHSGPDTTFYVAPSGAGVFDAGSLYFDCALGPHPTGCAGYGPILHQSAGLQRLVRNFIDEMLHRAR